MSSSGDSKPGADPVTEGMSRAEASKDGIELDGIELGDIEPGDVEQSAVNPSGTASAKPRGSRRIAWTFLLVIVLVVFVTGFVISILLGPRLSSILPWGTDPEIAAVPVHAEKIAALEVGVVDIARRATELGEQIARQADKPAPRDFSGDIAAQRAVLSGFDDRLSVFEKIQASALTDIDKRVVAVEQALATLSVALARMAAIERGLEELAQAGNADAVATDLVARLEALEIQLGERDAGPAPAAATDEGEKIGRRLDDLEQRLAGLPSIAANGDGANERVDRLETVLAGLAGRIDNLNAGARLQLGRGVAVLLAAGTLRDATRRDGGYASELATFRELGTGIATLEAVPAVEALAELDKYAVSGAPTTAVLAARFGASVRAIVQAAQRDDEAGWISQTIDRVASVVTVRRIGDVDGASVEARVARAELRVAAGDIAAAVRELATLSGSTAAAAAPWLDEANARLAVDAAARQIYEASARALLTGVPSE